MQCNHSTSQHITSLAVYATQRAECRGGEGRAHKSLPRPHAGTFTFTRAGRAARKDCSGERNKTYKREPIERGRMPHRGFGNFTVDPKPPATATQAQPQPPPPPPPHTRIVFFQAKRSRRKRKRKRKWKWKRGKKNHTQAGKMPCVLCGHVPKFRSGVVQGIAFPTHEIQHKVGFDLMLVNAVQQTYALFALIRTA